MTEYEKRTKFVGTASTYLGMAGLTQRNREFCDIYNNYLPTANSLFGTRMVKYIVDNQMKAGWGWCGVFVSVIAIICGFTFIPIEMGLGEYVNIAKRLKIWKGVPHTPKGGDIVLYKWRDANGNPSSSNPYDHIEIVEGLSDGILKTIGGNNGGKPGICSRREIRIDDPSIVGFVTPNYADDEVVVAPATPSTPAASEDTDRAVRALKVLESMNEGDTLEYVGHSESGERLYRMVHTEASLEKF